MRIRTLVALLLLLVSATPSWAEPMYDAVADFSTNVNSETSIWSYRYHVGTSRDGNYPLLPTYGPANGNWSPANPNVWKLSTNDGPEIGVNLTGADVTNSATPAAPVTWDLDGMVLRPVAGQLAILSWLFPLAERSKVSYQFTSEDIDVHGGDGYTLYFEVRNTNGDFISGGFGGGGDGNHGGGGPVVNFFNPGDRLNFILDPKQNAAFDSTRLTLSISIVPEPASGVTLGIAALTAAAALFAHRGGNVAVKK